MGNSRWSINYTFINYLYYSEFVTWLITSIYIIYIFTKVVIFFKIYLKNTGYFVESIRCAFIYNNEIESLNVVSKFYRLPSDAAHINCSKRPHCSYPNRWRDGNFDILCSDNIVPNGVWHILTGHLPTVWCQIYDMCVTSNGVDIHAILKGNDIRIDSAKVKSIPAIHLYSVLAGNLYKNYWTFWTQWVHNG